MSGDRLQREVSDGFSVWLDPMLYNLRLVYGPTGSPFYERAFCFAKAHWEEALEALGQWSGEGDPPGPWIKEVGTDRYGPGMAQIDGS